MNTQLDHLLQMANDIAVNLSAEQPPQAAALAISAHIKRFWAPPMRALVIDALPTKSQALHPNALSAFQLLDNQGD